MKGSSPSLLALANRKLDRRHNRSAQPHPAAAAMVIGVFLCSRQSLVEHMVGTDKKAQTFKIRMILGCFWPPTASLVSVRPVW